MNASPAAVPSTASTAGGTARATSSPPSSSTAPSAPSVTAVSLPPSPTTSHSSRLTTRRSGSTSTRRAGAAFRQKNEACAAAAWTAPSGISSWQSTASASPDTDVIGPQLCVRPWSDDDRRLAVGRHLDQRHAGRRVLLDHAQRHASFPQAGERLLRERVATDRADERHLGPKPAAATAWLAPLPPG